MENKEYYANIVIFDQKTEEFETEIVEDYKLLTYRQCSQRLINKGYKPYYILLDEDEKNDININFVKEESGYVANAVIVKKKVEVEIKANGLNEWMNYYYGEDFF